VGKPSLKTAQPYAKAEGRVFLLVLAYPGCPGTKTVKRLVLLLLLLLLLQFYTWTQQQQSTKFTTKQLGEISLKQTTYRVKKD